MLHQQALVVVYMCYFVRQIFLWGFSFPHDSVHFVRQLPFRNPKRTVSSASTQRDVQAKKKNNTQCFCDVERLIIDLKQKPWWLLHSCTSGKGRVIVWVWHRQTNSPRCLTGAGSRGLLDLQRGHWTGYHALWSHSLSRADGEDACLLSPTHCWQVPLTAMYFPGAAVMVNRKPPRHRLIPTSYSTFINNIGSLSPEDVFIDIASKIKLNMTNK